MNSLKINAVVNDDENIFELVSEQKTVMKIFDKNRKEEKKKYLFNIFGEEEEEIEDLYDDHVYEPMRYPPESVPPTVNNEKSLNSHFMVYQSTIRP